MNASDIMTADVLSVGPDSSVVDAARLMLERKISGLVVMDGGKLVGIVTEGDLLRRQETGTARTRPRWLELIVGPGKMADEYTRSSGRKVHEVMSTHVHTVSPNAELAEVVNAMDANDVKRLPVMRGNSVVGIITRSDIMRAFLAAAKPAKPLPDSEIRALLAARLEKENWAPTGTISVAVEGGIVTLSGVVMDDRQRKALEVAAENIPGVTAVKNELVWIDPVSGMTVET